MYVAPDPRKHTLGEDSQEWMYLDLLPTQDAIVTTRIITVLG